MSLIKSFSVGNGDMFYIQHNSDNFTIIDCCLDEDNQERIVEEIKEKQKDKEITRFISTHPDDDHIAGLDYLDEELKIMNFYCVANSATKEDATDCFTHYCSLRDHETKKFHIFKGCTRKWMNISDDDRGSSGITILWPDLNNEHYVEALEDASNGESPNNISPILLYSLKNGAKVLWMGDLESDFMELIEDELDLPEVDILFAPHHGRHSGKIPESILGILKPKIIVIGEAPSHHLNYYNGYDTITQNSAGDITLECIDDKIHIYVSEVEYEVDFLDDQSLDHTHDFYIGSLNL